MKRLILIVVSLAFLLSLTSFAFAYDWGRDAYGHRTKYKNYWNDRDGDGVPNYYDRRDDNRNRW